MATILYTAQVPLTVSSVIATWSCEAGQTLPLDPSRPSTLALLAAGDITEAGPGSVDDTTPAHIERGMPGMKVAVSN